MTRITALIVLSLFSSVSCADYLEVRRVSDIHAEPSRSSEVLATVGPSDDEPLFILHISDDEPIERGWLAVQLPAEEGVGFIYKTSGRVYRDHDGGYEPYVRSDYRHWVDNDKDCFDSRAEALLRDDTSGNVKTEKRAGKCKVISGRWLDPYSNQTFTAASKMDVDHFVPLKNAHESGAWSWSPERKRQYANFLDNDFHLLSVSASENRGKGDKGPDRYLPSNDAYHCEYVNHWLDIKHEWGLKIPAGERSAIDTVLESCP